MIQWAHVNPLSGSVNKDCEDQIKFIKESNPQIHRKFLHEKVTDILMLVDVKK